MGGPSDAGAKPVAGLHEKSVAKASDAMPRGTEEAPVAPAGQVDKSGDNIWGGIFPGQPDRRSQTQIDNGHQAKSDGGGSPENGGQGGGETQNHLPEVPAEIRKEMDRGIDLLHANKWDEADILFTGVIESNPDLFEPYDHRSTIYYNRQDYKKVAEDCSKAIEIARKTGTFAQTCPDRCLMRRGASYLNLEMWAEALVDFTEVLEYRKNDGFAHFERGRSLFGLGRYEEAKKDFERSLELDDKHPVSSELSVYYLNKIANPDFH